MIFLRLNSVTILLIVLVLLVWFKQELLHRMSETSYVALISMCILILKYTITTYFKVKDDILSKYTFFFKTNEWPIDSIKLIEAVTVTKVGHIYINTASDPEDYYIIKLRDGKTIK